MSLMEENKLSQYDELKYKLWLGDVPTLNTWHDTHT